MKKLEEMSEKIKEDSITLQEAMECYREGLECYNLCKKILNDAKQQIITYEEGVN
ncbi:MAG: exodeoxyribonuclease VII small subunit [Firmicutes bacterium]|nr:exodeoxyribonuclease VII small subunit [Bacillota bacterium]